MKLGDSVRVIATGRIGFIAKIVTARPHDLVPGVEYGVCYGELNERFMGPPKHVPLFTATELAPR